ncbi:L-fuculokinase [Endozoicomonas euniceicola]|uniref:L-fuculokinase n=1 Tax=Endozoicomonas euniceicola TaxID=1234143 RepID=A0ABY6H1V3_9GAMM|nr:L-fuculokinase [Endozoicomonas euniceicola]UYM18251.1 L-fuculokinase [Endozoicomonas euniceicola]
MKQDVVIVLDCGATNIRAIAVNTCGQVIAKATQPNATSPSIEKPSWLIWPLDELFKKFCLCCQDVVKTINPEQVKGITVTTFGVDGGLVDRNGELIYPVISWQCPRTSTFMQNLGKYLNPEDVTIRSGVGHFAFNTLNKLIWFKENRPELLADARGWMFISSLFTHRLTGRMTNDASMIGTAQLTDLKTQSFSETILSALDISTSFFPGQVQAGEVIGVLLAEPAEKLGLQPGIPVISTGHDTQFAVYGSGASEGQPVLSSGTWEILMARTQRVSSLSPNSLADGFTCEWDAQKGYYNPGAQWLASAVLEWIGKQFYPELKGSEKYTGMIREATNVPPGCDGVSINPDFFTDANDKAPGSIRGLTLNTQRGSIYRAALEGLSNKLKANLHQLEQLGNFSAAELILVGGGSKNQLWNQIKADSLQIPVKVPREADTTALGAAMFTMAGAGLFENPESARAAFNLQYQTINPGR